MAVKQAVSRARLLDCFGVHQRGTQRIGLDSNMRTCDELTGTPEKSQLQALAAVVSHLREQPLLTRHPL